MNQKDHAQQKPAGDVLSSQDVALFHRQGYIHIKDVFAHHELEYLRVTDPLDGAWTDPRLIAIARALLVAQPVFFFATSFDRRDNRVVAKFSHRKTHQDARGTPDHLFNRYHKPAVYPVLRFGIYFQDYSQRAVSGALKVSPGSHLVDTTHFDDMGLKFVNVPAAPGDVVIFNKRLLHSGHSLLLRHDPEIALPTSLENALLAAYPELFLPLPDIREALFVDYCDRSTIADIHIKSTMLNESSKRTGYVERISPELLARCRAEGLDLRIDAALIECCDEALAKRKPNGNFMETARPALEAFARLAPLAEEYGSFYPLWSGLPEGMAGCVMAAERIVHYRRLYAAYDADPHMKPRTATYKGEVTPELLEQFRSKPISTRASFATV